MEFVRNSYTWNAIPEPWEGDEILKHIEAIGRLCYRSDDLIADDSAAGFIDRLKKRKHWAMLEHYIFTISVPASVFQSIVSSSNFTMENADYIDKFRFIRTTEWPDAEDPELRYLVSGSATAFNYLWACKPVMGNPKHGINQICNYLMAVIPDLMYDPWKRTPSDDPDYWEDKWDTQIQCIGREVVSKLPKELRLIHDWMSVHFVVERSSTHDLVRHRPASYAQESTRYCNYSKKGLCFIIPCQFTEHDKEVLENPEKVAEMIKYAEYKRNIYDMQPAAYHWFRVILAEANAYEEFIAAGWSPQESKSVIPHALRAEINITAFKGEWVHIFDMRADKAAFPQIQEVMVPLLKESIERDPEVFGDLQQKVNEGAKWLLR